MKSLRVEQVAWLALMTSFVAVCGVLYGYRGTVLGEFHAQTFVTLLDEARDLDRDGNAAQAEGVYATLLERYPDSEELLVAYAEHLDSQGEMDRAEATYARAAALGRQQFSAVRRYTAFLERDGRGEEAAAFLDDYLNQFPDDLTAQLDLGFVYLRLQRWHGAIAPLERAAERPDLAFSARVNLAGAYVRMERLEDAIQEWQRVVAMSPESGKQQYWQDIAAACELLGDTEAAREAWRVFLDRFPNSMLAAERLLAMDADNLDPTTLDRAALRLRAVSPELPINEPIVTGIQVTGVSRLKDSFSPGETVTIEVWFQISATILESTLVRFSLRDPEGSVRELISEPAVVGSPPLWRGDTVHQRFAIVLPGDLPAGNYELELRSTAPESTVTLWTLNVGDAAGEISP